MIPHCRPTLGPEEKQACAQVLDSLQIAQGEKVWQFEQQMSRLTGRRYGVAVSSGTSALTLALEVLGVSSRDEVIVPSFTCAALLHAVAAVGAKPVAVDMDPEDLNVSAGTIRKKIRKKTRAVILPHLFGRAAQMQEILRLGIPVIEDGTQALGAQAGGQPVGSFGILSVFSFYATKMITTGEGGMILTDSKSLAAKLTDRRAYDKKRDYRPRTNAKMTDIAAAIGIEQLKKLPGMIKARRDLAACYHVALETSGVGLPLSDTERDHVYFRYVIRIPRNASAWIRKLNEKGVEAKLPVFKPLHRYLNGRDHDFPVTARAFRETCSLPIFPAMEAADCSRVCEALKSLVLSGPRSGRVLATVQ